MKAIWTTTCSGGRFARALTKTWLSLLLPYVWSAALQATAGASMPPRIFYSDLTSGPASGGVADQGAFVTIYGRGFGPAQGGGYVTVGESAAAAYPLWSDKKITFQLGRKARSGAIVVHMADGGASNGVPFSVRPGRILFYPSGNVTTTLQEMVSGLRAGDILYLRDRVDVHNADRYEAVLNFMNSGREENPIALLAYPNANVTVGAVGGPRIAARTPNVQRTSNHWVIAGINFRGNQEALDITDSTDWRLVGNTFTCPHGFGPTGCIEMSQVSKVSFFGNLIHDIGEPGTTKVYHALYFSTDSNHIDVGWNTIAHVRGCRGLQFHSSPTDPGTGRNQYDLQIHDNVIYDTVCDGINLATVDPSAGPIKVFNNLIYEVGKGPDPPDGSANYACIYVQGGANAGPAGRGHVDIYNNTMYRCGERRNTDSGAIALSGGSPQQEVHLRNNVIVLDAGVPLLSPNSTVAPLRASANILWWLRGETWKRHKFDGFLVTDPLLLDPKNGNFHPSDTSPAMHVGAPTLSDWTLDGRERTRPSAGAY